MRRMKYATIVVFGFMMFGFGIMHSSPAYAEYMDGGGSSEMLAAINTDRAAAGDQPLRIDNRLVSAAQTKVNDMAAKNYWAHTSPDGTQPWTLISQAGYPYITAGENLAYGFSSADAVIVGWMNSPEHREIMLKSEFTDIGFGIYDAANYQGSEPVTIVAAEFGSQASKPKLEPTAATTPPPSTSTGINVSASVGPPPTNSTLPQSPSVTTKTLPTTGKTGVLGRFITSEFAKIVANSTVVFVSFIVPASLMFMFTRYIVRRVHFPIFSRTLMLHHLSNPLHFPHR